MGGLCCAAWRQTTLRKQVWRFSCGRPMASLGSSFSFLILYFIAMSLCMDIPPPPTQVLADVKAKCRIPSGSGPQLIRPDGFNCDPNSKSRLLVFSGALLLLPHMVFWVTSMLIGSALVGDISTLYFSMLISSRHKSCFFLKEHSREFSMALEG